MPKPKNFTDTSAAKQFVCGTDPVNASTTPVTAPVTPPSGANGEVATATSPDKGTPSASETAFVPVRDTSEKKTKRVQLLMRPSVWRAAKRAAKLAGVSLNEYIEQLLEHTIGEEKK